METTSHPYEFKLIKAKEITIDHLYQRGSKKQQIKEIVNNFDYHKVNPVKVVYRDGEYFAFDGYQTTTGLRTKFGDNYLVPCLIYYDVPTWIDEAILFEGTNAKKFRKTVGARDLWKSRLNRGDETAMKIQKILERHHMCLYIRTNTNAVPGRVQALDAIEKVYEKLGDEKFEEMIEILDSSWHGTAESLAAPMLRGMGCFINSFYGKYDKKRLIKKLSYPTAIGTIIAGGSSGRRGEKKYAAEILSIYNDHIQKDSPNYLDEKLL